MAQANIKRQNKSREVEKRLRAGRFRIVEPTHKPAKPVSIPRSLNKALREERKKNR
jgi:hypothetical protein